MLRAATARTDITPPVGIAHANWGAATHEQAEGVDLPLWATALVLETDQDEPVAVVDLDLLQLPTSLCAQVRARVSALAGIPRERIRISWTHTHSGPTLSTSTWVRGGVDMVEPYVRALPDRIAGIVWQARRRTRPVEMRQARGECRVNVNRRLRLPDGRIVVGQNPDGFVDPSVLLLRFDGEGGPITVVSYACHPTIMAHRNRLITPDYPGVVKRVVETAVGGHCLFLQGAAGNQCSIEDLTSDRESYRRIGSVIGHEAARLAWACITPPRPMRFDRVVESGAPLGLFRYEAGSPGAARVAALERPVKLPARRLPPISELRERFERAAAHLEALRQKGAGAEEIRDATFRAKRASHLLRLAETTGGAEEVEVPVHLLRIGDVALVGLPVEPFAEIGAAIREASPFPVTWVSGYTNGVMGYLPTQAAFHEGGYEVDTSPFTAEAEERLVAGVLALLDELRRR